MADHPFSSAQLDLRLRHIKALRSLFTSCAVLSTELMKVRGRMEGGNLMIVCNGVPCLYWLIQRGHCGLYDVREGLERLAVATTLAEIEDETKKAIKCLS